jgi:hypothetical protein
MIIKVGDHPPKFKRKIICVLTTNWACQNSIATPSYKNNVCLKIMDRPQIHNSMVELLLLIIVIRFDSFPQLFQHFN